MRKLTRKLAISIVLCVMISAVGAAPLFSEPVNPEPPGGEKTPSYIPSVNGLETPGYLTPNHLLKNSFFENQDAVYVEPASTAQTGALRVTIEPETALNAGARWSVNNGVTWHQSGTTETLPTGTYTVIFKRIAGWYRPASVSGLTVNPNATTEITGNYNQAPGINRIAGDNRFHTAVQISVIGWPDGAGTVVLARGDDYADALAGSVLAYSLDAPVLLTRTDTLVTATRDEILRLGASRVILLGGPTALSETVEQQLSGLVAEVERIGGDNRFHTAALIAERLMEEKNVETLPTAFIAYGYNFPDAMAATSYAALQGSPILLTNTDQLSPFTAAALELLGVTDTVVVGSTAVIADALLADLPDPERVAGSNRYATAAALAERFLPPGQTHLYLATGLTFPDALSGAVLAAKKNSGILLTGNSLSSTIKQLVLSHNITSVSILGGPATVSQDVENSLAGLEDPFTWAFMPATQKVFPETIPGSTKSASLYGAKNEYLNIQLVLLSDEHITIPVSCNFGDLFEAKYIDTPRTTSWGQWRSEHKLPRYPDPLPPAGEIQLAPGQAKSLWLRVRANHSHQGVVQIGNVNAPVSVTVWPWEMPAAPSLKTSVGLGGPGLANYYNLSFNSEAYWEMYVKYYEVMLDYRISAYHLPYGYGTVAPRAEKYLTDPRVSTFRIESVNSSLWNLLGQHNVRHKAWVYNYDEPTTLNQYAQITSNAGNYHQNYPGIKYGVPFYHGAYMDDDGNYLPQHLWSTPYEHMVGSVNIWIPQIDYYTHGHAGTNKIQRQSRERWLAGDEIWAYTALAPRGDMPNILLNNTALEHRLLFWQIYSEEIFSGYLYWHSTYWNNVADPWTDQETVKHFPGLWGDGSLFYPLPDGPCGSIRLEMIRAGLQDYELLLKAEQVLGRPAVMAKVQQVTRAFNDYTRDPALFEAVRAELGEALAKEL